MLCDNSWLLRSGYSIIRFVINRRGYRNTSFIGIDKSYYISSNINLTCFYVVTKSNKPDYQIVPHLYQLCPILRGIREDTVRTS